MPRPRGSGSVYRQKNSAVWWVKYYRNGRPVRQSTHTKNERQAESFLRKKLGEVESGNYVAPIADRIKVEQLADAMLRDYRNNGRKSVGMTEQRLRKHVLPYFGSHRAVDVTSDLLDKYVEKRRLAGAANGTINREFSALKRAFGLGFHSTPRKVHQIPLFPHLKESAPRKGFVEDVQYASLCEEATELWLRTMLALGYTFGFREGELLELRVGQVDLLGRTLRLNPGETKNGDGRMVKLTAETYQLLRECLRGKDADDYVFTRVERKRIRDLRGAWWKLCTAAGLGSRRCAACEHSISQTRRCEHCGSDRIKYEGLLFHDLRRSAVRNMLRRGVPERVAMTISGHKTRAIFDRYNIVSESDLADAAQKLEAGRTVVVGHTFGHTDASTAPSEPQQPPYNQ